MIKNIPNNTYKKTAGSVILIFEIPTEFIIIFSEPLISSKKAKIEQLEPMEIVQKYTLYFHNVMSKFNTLPFKEGFFETLKLYDFLSPLFKP